ncbi:MAG: HAD-IB family phosphatase [Candidatus Methylacidiphilales bacterium]
MNIFIPAPIPENLMSRLIVLDCDSTLSSIEGVDELARMKGAEIYQQVEEATQRAMEGAISLESVFRFRMELIRPTSADLETLSRLYIETLAPGALEVIHSLQASGWITTVVSGGLLPPVRALSDHLGIREVMAVPVFFNPDGSYLHCDTSYPTAVSGGKPLCLQQLKARYQPDFTVMVGDGVSDLETKPEVDLFIGFGGFAERQRVREEAHHFILHFNELTALLPA